MKRRLGVAPGAVGVMLAGTLTLVPGIAHASEAVGLGLGLGSATLAGPADEISATDLAVIEDELSQPRDGMIYSDDLSGESLDQDTDFSGTSPEQEGELELTTDGSEEGGDAFLGTPEGDDTTTKPGESADEAGLASGSPAGDAPEAGVDGSAEEAPSDDGDEVPVDDVNTGDREVLPPASDDGLASETDEREPVAGNVSGKPSEVVSDDDLSDKDLEAQKSEEKESEAVEEEDSVASLSEEVPAAAEAKAVTEKAANVQLYRLYNPNSGEHLYTLSQNERRVLASLGWVDEGNAWVSPETSDVKVYRLYNPNSGDHHYTMSLNEYNALGGIGWVREGLAWYGSASDGVALFRLFNPNVSVGTHHFTPSALERMKMVSDGWVYEGIAWFGVDLGPLAPAGAASGWATNGGARFYIDGSGKAGTGWQTIDGTKYHFDSKGRLSTGVTDVDGTIYYFQDSGAAHKGWATLSADTYYFNTDGALPRSGCSPDGGKPYYLDPTSGAAATGKRWINGYLRPFDSNGVCLKTGYQTKWGNLMLAARNVTLPGYAQGSYWSYVHPCTISANATRAEVIEAFINAAYDYQRTPTRWVDNQCGRPGTTVDCSGLVMESLYAVGMDLTGVAGGDFNPYSKYYWNHHFANTWRTNNTFQPISVSQLERGDIIYYSGHVVIYLGNGRILESTPYASNVRESSMYSPGTILGCARPFTK